MSNNPKPSFENFLKEWVDDIEKLKKELAEKAPQSFILKDLESLIPKKLSPKKYLDVINVLIDIINISDSSLWNGWAEELKRYEGILERKDPKKLLEMRKEKLCQIAYKLKDPREGWTHNGKQMHRMIDMDVLVIANGENKYSLISKKEFNKLDAKGDSAICGYFNTWKTRKKITKPTIKK